MHCSTHFTYGRTYFKNTGLTASSTGQKNGKAITERQTIWEDGVLE